MSVTVADLLNLPSLRQAKVLGGRNGLGKIVSSISVLESVDPGILIDPLFPQGEFYGSEIVITGFLNCRDDVQRQCDNLRRLAQGGEVGLILYYVGIYMPKVDPKLIQLADELDFVLICMPEGEQALRYGEVINDVTACIFRDQAKQNSIVLDILERVSALPKHQQSVNTVMKMLSDRICATVILCDAAFHILNLVTWPRSTENRVKEQLAWVKEYLSGVKGTFVADIYGERLLLFLSTPPSLQEAEQMLMDILKGVAQQDANATLTRCSQLMTTGDVRTAYQTYKEHLGDAQKIFPLRRIFTGGDLEFACHCRQLIQKDEAGVKQCLAPLAYLQTDGDDMNLQRRWRYFYWMGRPA